MSLIISQPFKINKETGKSFIPTFDFAVCILVYFFQQDKTELMPTIWISNCFSMTVFWTAFSEFHITLLNKVIAVFLSGDVNPNIQHHGCSSRKTAREQDSFISPSLFYYFKALWKINNDLRKEIIKYRVENSGNMLIWNMNTLDWFHTHDLKVSHNILSSHTLLLLKLWQISWYMNEETSIPFSILNSLNI